MWASFLDNVQLLTLDDSGFSPAALSAANAPVTVVCADWPGAQGMEWPTQASARVAGPVAWRVRCAAAEYPFATLLSSLAEAVAELGPTCEVVAVHLEGGEGCVAVDDGDGSAWVLPDTTALIVSRFTMCSCALASASDRLALLQVHNCQLATMKLSRVRGSVRDCAFNDSPSNALWGSDVALHIDSCRFRNCSTVGQLMTFHRDDPTVHPFIQLGWESSALIERCHFAQPQPVHEGYHHAVVVGSSVSSVFDSIGKRKLMGLLSLLAQHSGCAKGSEEEAAHVAASFARMASARQIPPGVLTLRDNVVDLPGCSIICPVALGQPCLHFDDACSALAAFERHQGIKCVTEVPLTATWPSLGGSFRAAREEWCLAGPFPTSSEAVWAEYCRVRREVERLSKLLATIQPSEEDLCDVDPDSHEADAELLQAANRRREKLLAARAPPDGSAQFFTLLLCLMRLGVHLPVELLMVIRRFATTPALPALSTLYVATNWEDVDMLRTVHAGTCLWTETGSCLVLEYSWHERARMTFCEMFEEVSLTAVPLTDVSSLLHFRASPHYQHRVHLMRYDDSQTHQVFVRRSLDDPFVATALPQLLFPHAPQLVSPCKAFELLLTASGAGFFGHSVFSSVDDDDVSHASVWPVLAFAQTNPPRRSESVAALQKRHDFAEFPMTNDYRSRSDGDDDEEEEEEDF